MTDWKSLRIPADDFERHNSRRKEMELTWQEYIDGEAPEYVDLADVVREAAREGAREAVEEVARA